MSTKMSLGVRARMLIGFVSVVVLFMLAIGVTLVIINNAKNYTKQMIEVDLPTYNAFIDLNSNVYSIQAAVEGWLLTNNAEYKTEYNKSIELIDEKIAILDTISNKWQDSTVMSKWQNAKNVLEKLKIAYQKIINISTNDKAQAISLLTNEAHPLKTQLEEIINTSDGQKSESIIDIQSKTLHTETVTVIKQFGLIQAIGYILSAVGFITAMLIAYYTTRRILKHIEDFRRHSSRIASGDLTQSIAVETNDELGQLGNDLNKMTEGLSEITKQIIESSHNMVSTLEEVRHVVDVQSSGATEQASSINQITASLAEIEKSSNQTLEKAKALGESAERTREKGQLGLEAVDQSVNGMKAVREKVQMIAQTILDLSNQTQQVGEITSVVNNLAQQSKMLALNASIEAAKAGEAGKGFAVVAVEVKNLAELSEQSTSQVQKILEDIRHAAEKAVMVTEEGTKGVDTGTSLVEQTGEIIRNLNEVIHETTLATQQIEAAVRQEGAGIEQITAGMNEINQVTASSVESVKQTTEAMGNLSNIARNLKTHVDTYKLKA